MIVITTLEGRLRSLPVTYMDLEATARANAGAAAAPISGTSKTTQPAPLSTAPPASTDSIENARRALELYGERELFVAMHAQARSALTSLEGRAPKDFYDLLMDAIRRGFDPDALMERSASRLAADADRALLTDWLRWLETPSIRAIAEAEKAADRPEAEAERKEFVAGLAQSPPTASRERLVARLSEALSLAERSFELLQLGQTSVQTGLREAFPNAPVNEPEQSLEELRAEMLPTLEEQTRQSLLFKYRNIAGSDLERYIAYWESTAGQEIGQSLNNAMDDALRYAGQTMGRILGEEGKPFLEAAARGRELQSEPRVFEELNFRFTPPAQSGWVSLNTEAVNPDAILGYMRRHPEIYLMIFAEDIGGVEFTSEAAAELASAGLESASQSYRLVSREPSTVSGLLGLRLVSEAEVANQSLTYVQWVGSRNGYLFQLVAYAASETASEAAFYEKVDEVFSGFELLDLERIATSAAGFASDYSSERYGYSLSLAGSAWRPWNNQETEAPSADIAGLHGVDSAFMVVPVSLRGLDPSLAVLSDALLAELDIPFSETTRRAEQPAGGEAYELGYEREVEGTLYEYRLHVRKTPDYGYLVAAWTARNGGSRPRIDALVEGFRVDPEPSAESNAAWTARERTGQAQILSSMGVDYLEQDQAPRAREFLEAAFALDTDNPLVLENLVASLAGSGKDEEGLLLLEKHLDRFPSESSLASYRPYFQTQLGMNEEAAANYQELFVNGYRNDHDLNDYTELLWGLGRADEALSIVAGYRQERDSPAAARLEARLFARNGGSDRAIAIYEAQHEALPNDIELARQLIDIYYDVEQYERSRELAVELLASGHESTDLHFRKALGEMALGRYQEAKQSLEAALDLSPGNATAREHLDYVSGVLGQGDHEALRRPIPPLAFPDRLKETPELAVPLDDELLDYGAYYESAVTAISYESSGEFRQTDFYRIRIVDAKAIPLFNTFRFTFDPLRERIHVNGLEVRDASGDLVLEGGRSDYYVVDDGSESIASQKKTVTIPVRGLAVGHTITLSVTRLWSSAPDAMPFIRHSFSMTTPVLRSQLYVTGDIDALKVLSVNNVPPENVASDAITWTMERPPVYHAESVADFGESFLPFVWITDRAKSWESVGTAYLDDIRERLALDPEAAALARSLTADSRSDEDRVRTIARYVQDNYTYKTIAFGRAAWLPNPVGQIIQNKYGDCKDHALLFYQLLRALEVPVELVLIHSGRPVQNEIPSLDQFDHMIAFVPSYENGHDFDLTDKGYDSATTSTPLGLGGNVALLLDETTTQLVELPDYSSDSSVVTLVRQVSVVENDIDVQETVTLSGYYAAFWRMFLVDSDSATRHRLVQSQMGRSAAVRLRDVSAQNLDDPLSALVLKLNYRVENAFNRVEGKLVGKVPAVWERRLLGLEYAEGRKTPYRIAYPLTVTSEVSLIAPSGYRLSQGAEPIASPDSDLVEWTVDSELNQEGAFLRYYHRRSARRGSAAEYEVLRRAVDRSLDAIEATWVLEASDP